jgi:hypothetical protein
MARVRRKPSVTTRWNFEIAGIVALGIAILLAVSLIVPSAHTGFVGVHTAAALHALFGYAAGWFPLLIALLATIVFLEINVPRMIATLGGAACAYFLIVDAALAANGGWLGRTLDAGLRALLGDVGTVIVLLVAALGVTVWITNVSVKKVIGWTIARLAALRPPPRPARPARSAALEAAEPAPGPRTLREAFHLPALFEPRPAAAPVAASAVPARRMSAAVVVEDAIEHETEDEDEVEDTAGLDLEADEDDEFEDDEFDEDDEDADDEEEDEEEEPEP